MSYSVNIPNNGSFLGTVQKQLLANYQQIYRSFAQDHIQLDATNKGKHRALTLRVQPGDPSTSANQAALYNKLQTVNYELFFRPSSDQAPIQLTSLNGILATGDDQYSYMAGPFSIYFGVKRDVIEDTLVTLTPASTLVYVGVSTHLLGGVKPGRATRAIAVAMTDNTFRIQYNNTVGGITTPPHVYYMAIGI